MSTPDDGARHLEGISGLERVMAAHWRPARVESLDGWLLRAGGGWTGRANSALALGGPAPTDRLGQVRLWYDGLGLPARLAVPVPWDAPPPPGGHPDAGVVTADDLAPGSPPDGPARRQVQDGVRAAGWVAADGPGAYVFTARTATLLVGHCGPDGDAVHDRLPLGLRLDLADLPDEAWLSRYRYQGRDLPPDAVDLLLSAPRQVFVSIRTSGRADGGDRTTVAVARGSLGEGWAGVTAVDVDPQFRRQGLAGVTLTALARWADQGGAASMFLQTAVGNGAAQRLYRRAGLAVHHRYDYWAPGPSASTVDHQDS